jgi:hypothetical protein
MTAATGTSKRNRLLPSWVLKLIGFGSIATAVIGFALYWFKKYPPRRRVDQAQSDDSNAEVVEIMS